MTPRQALDKELLDLAYDPVRRQRLEQTVGVDPDKETRRRAAQLLCKTAAHPGYRPCAECRKAIRKLDTSEGEAAA